MNHIEVIDGIIELARTGQQFPPGEALSAVARLIADLSPQEPSYEARVAALMEIGATLWRISVEAGVAELDASVAEFLRER